MCYSHRHVLDIVLKLTKKIYATSERVDLFRECRSIKLNNVCNGNSTRNCPPFFFRHDRN